MELDEKFNLLRTLTQKIRSYDKHLIDTVTFCNNKMSSIVYDYGFVNITWHILFEQ